MSQLLRVQCFNVSRDGFGAGDGQSLDRPFGHGANPGRPVLVGRRHRELGEPHRPRRESRTRRLLHPRLHAQHRRRDHGSQQVRSPAWPVGEPRLEGLVGRHAAVPHAGVRAHPPRAPVVHPVRHHVPLPRRHTRRSPAAGQARPQTARTCGSVAASPPSASSSTPTSSTRCTSPSRRSSSAAANASGPPTSELLDRFHLESVPEPQRRDPPAVLAPVTTAQIQPKVRSEAVACMAEGALAEAQDLRRPYGEHEGFSRLRDGSCRRARRSAIARPTSWSRPWRAVRAPRHPLPAPHRPRRRHPVPDPSRCTRSSGSRGGWSAG